MRDIFSILLLPAILFLMFCLAIFGMNYKYEEYNCNKYGENTSKPTKYDISGCYINDSGKWYIWQEYKYRFITKGEM